MKGSNPAPIFKRDLTNISPLVDFGRARRNRGGAKAFSKPEVYKIYKTLYDYYGTQNWWPADSEFEVIVGAVLTQNTAWRNVEKAINNLKAKNILNLRKLAKLPTSKLSQLIRPSGFYRVKTKRLKSLLDFLITEYSGDLEKLKKQKLSLLRQQLLQVHGIGEETADSILLYALKKPVFVVDAYTKRIFSRHNYFNTNPAPIFKRHLTNISPLVDFVRTRRNRGGANISYSAIQEFFTRNLPKSILIYQEYHALLVKLAKDYCRTKAICLNCPISAL